ncbi:MAG: GNAT family N-acetyltransferase [Gemmatimonadetes bacterium]|nr:GNAT family N-acetyltransferase [Gemmatimonadota bacterium]MBT4101012.1 GNAT family N-acetyltransferase [Gemmatimonadota bacterium]MBT7861279.1 GNAT family N-acetyltransferase [Gemmatimonadota bacterium]
MSRVIRHVTYRSSDADKVQALQFWDSDYTLATQSRLTSPWDDEIYGLAAAFENEQCIGTASYTISPHRLGILSQVYTNPDFRGQGIARKSLSAALDAFQQQQTRAVYLASAKDWVQRIYQGMGFEFVGAMGARHAFKLTLDDSGRDENLFRAGQQVSLRTWAAHDQADLSALFNARHDGLVKHYQLGCYLGSHFEGEFYQLRRYGEERPGFQALVLEGEETLLGIATVVPSSRRHAQHRGVVDLLLHPNYAGHAADLLATLHEKTDLRSLNAYAGVHEPERQSMFETAGYRRAGKLTRHLRIAAQDYDLEMFERQQKNT